MTNDFCPMTDRRLAILTFFFDASNLSPLRVDIINTAVLLMLLTTPCYAHCAFSRSHHVFFDGEELILVETLGAKVHED